MTNGRNKNNPAAARLFLMVGVSGLEPETSSMSTKRSNQLSYTPIACVNYVNCAGQNFFKAQ